MNPQVHRGRRQLLDALPHEQLWRLVREYLLCGHMIDRSLMPQILKVADRETMVAVAIDEWMGASPIYTKRIQKLLGFEGDTVETMFKGMQLDIGAPPEFLDFRYRVSGPNHGSFRLEHCGALMDAEPMGDEMVFGMCHTIEDPTFEATACASNPRARMEPVHRPPRRPADRHPHCEWRVSIDPAAEPLALPAIAEVVAASSVAQSPLAAIRGDSSTSTRADRDAGAEGRETRVGAARADDYKGSIETPLDLSRFSAAALRAIAEEVCLQGQLLALSGVEALQLRFTPRQVAELVAESFEGIAGAAAKRLLRPDSGLWAQGLPNSFPERAQRVLVAHPAFGPTTIVDWEVTIEGPCVVAHLGSCAAARQEVGWLSTLASGDARALRAVAHAVDDRAVVEEEADHGGQGRRWRISLGDRRVPEPEAVLLTTFSTAADWTFSA